MKPQTSTTTDGLTSTGTTSDLDALDSLAAQVDADTSGTLPDGTLIADQPAPVNYAMEAAATVDTIAALVGGYCPTAGALWDNDRKAAVTQALAPVLEKYGITLGALPPELTLIIVAGPLLYQTSKAVAMQINTDRQKASPAKVAAHGTVTDLASVQPKPAATTPEVERHPQTALYGGQ